MGAYALQHMNTYCLLLVLQGLLTSDCILTTPAVHDILDMLCCLQGGLEPFIGFIMGPYDLQLPRPQSAITCFVVQHKGQALAPYNIR